VKICSTKVKRNYRSSKERLSVQFDNKQRVWSFLLSSFYVFNQIQHSAYLY